MNNTKDAASSIDSSKEDLFETLIAISVVAKKLANKIRQTKEKQKYPKD